MVAGPALFVVGKIFRVSVDPVPLPLFILVGVASWVFFRRSVQWFTKGMSKSRVILRRMYVPPLLLLLTSASPALFEFLVVVLLALGLAIYYAIQGIYYVDIGWHTLAIIPGLSMCLMLALGLGCFTSVLNIFARDTWLTMRYLFSVWMLITPVVYPIDVIPEKYRWIAYLNPLAWGVELFRWGMLDYGTIHWMYVGIAAVEILVLLLLGLWFFCRQQDWLLDQG